jgi:hypothetical protein
MDMFGDSTEQVAPHVAQQVPPHVQSEDLNKLREKRDMLADLINEKRRRGESVPVKQKELLDELNAKLGTDKIELKQKEKPKAPNMDGWSEGQKKAYALRQEWEKSRVDFVSNKTALAAFKRKIRATAKTIPEDDEKAVMMMDGLVTKVFGTDYDPKRADIEYGKSSLVKEGKQNLTNESKPVSMGAQENPRNGETMNDIGNVTYGGMTIYEMADVAARHGHNRDDAIAKISARPGAWIGVVKNWLESEKTDRLVQAKQDRDARWQPNEKQKRVLNLIRSKTRYLNDNDAPMFNHNKKSTLALIRRGLLSRVEYGDFVEYRINEKSKLDPSETAKKVIEWKAKRPKDAPISSPAGWISGWAYENGVKISDADEVAILGEIKKQIGVMKGDLKSFERQSNKKKEPKIILPGKPKKEK